VTAEQNPATAAKPVVVTAKALPLSCPMPNQSLWNAHPKVYLPIEKTGYAACPYCGTHYLLQSSLELPQP
jgi:uncharacterized Zn-finger protein